LVEPSEKHTEGLHDDIMAAAIKGQHIDRTLNSNITQKYTNNRLIAKI